MRILVVEDERKVASFIRRGLKEEGYAVDTAGDGEQGLYMAECDSYDVLVLDIWIKIAQQDPHLFPVITPGNRYFPTVPIK